MTFQPPVDYIKLGMLLVDGPLPSAVTEVTIEAKPGVPEGE